MNSIFKKVSQVLVSKEIKNTGWLVGGKVAQMILQFIIGVWTARYLGPSNYGLINYVASYTLFFTSLCTLGLTSSVLLNELTNKPDEEGLTLGTSLWLRFTSSFLSAIAILTIIYFVDKGDKTTIWIAIFGCITLLFQIFDVLEFWFQKRYLSKVTSIAIFVGYVVSAICKIYLLVNQKSMVWFAFATMLDYATIALVLFLVYKKYNGPKLKCSFAKGKYLLSISYHFILSGMMVAIYGQTDKIMLKQLLSETEVGYYSTASTLCNMWVFVLAAIITSLAPAIMKYKKNNDIENYERKNRQLYCVVFYVSIVVSIIYTILAPFIIRIIYGKDYLGSIQPLRVITWYVAFSYLGVARENWIVCEKLQKYSKYIYAIAAFGNVGLNFLLIPTLGATGAAMASLITQILTSVIIPLFFKDMRPNVKLIVQGITFYNLRKKKGLKKR